MRVLIVGCGNIGTVAADDIAKSMNEVEIVVADKTVGRAKAAVNKINRGNASWMQLDVTNYEKLTKALKDVDVAAGFLPGELGYRLAQACIATGKNLVDVSFTYENPLKLNTQAQEADITIIPDCGLAPGISNVLVGHTAKKLDKVQSVHIMVGGLPDRQFSPLDYVITWSPESLLDEYTRDARIIVNGKKVKTEALSGIEEVEFEELGKLEAFYTDGLRTLLNTIKNVENMWEKTLRYPGHCEKIKLLKALGLFDGKSLNIDGMNVSPRKLVVHLLKDKLVKPEVADVVALRVVICGVKDSKKTCYAFHLLDRFDRKHGVTAMARTTAYPASIVTQLLLKKEIKMKGVIPPERMGEVDSIFQQFLKALQSRGIKIREEKTSSKIKRSDLQ